MNADNINMILPGDEPLKNLKPVQIGINQYQVLSSRNGDVTAHLVDLNGDEPTCTCEDAQYNRQGQQICAHVAQVLLTADPTWSPEEMSMKALLNQLGEAKEATERIRDLEGMLGRIDEANRVAGQQGGETASEPDPVDPVEGLKDLLRSHDLAPDKFEWDEESSRLTFAPDGYLDDDEYSAFMDLTQGNDAIAYDGSTNYVEDDNYGKVFG